MEVLVTTLVRFNSAPPRIFPGEVGFFTSTEGVRTGVVKVAVVKVAVEEAVVKICSANGSLMFVNEVPFVPTGFFFNMEAISYTSVSWAEGKENWINTSPLRVTSSRGGSKGSDFGLISTRSSRGKEY